METEINVNAECELKPHKGKASHDLKTEEQSLKIQLENLKKENFSLEISIDAWKATFEQKQNELTEAELKLNTVYNEIWLTREEFCKRADEFNDRYGILSKWWEEKINFNPLLGNDEEKHLEKIKQLEMEIDELKKVLKKEEKPEENDIELPRGGNFNSKPEEESIRSEARNQVEFPENNETSEPANNKDCDEDAEISESPERGMVTLHTNSLETINASPKKKKVRFSKQGDEIKIFNEASENLKTKFFSIIDPETVKKANRIKNRQKNQFHRRIRKSPN